ncbi:Asp-tRNA(Asn)/Glu-tRNA(Gln) amidotransferase subunit GatB [Candidatus Micrarchaeota archaeon]|nr:Asp-tRNA(Asn)/Glu-tRNA(Gln) amidotransferase subunit GatB [Candidatus Micrarchaeota archaeon]
MKTIIGLEIHVQLNTDSKLFCECPVDYGHQEPNTNICPICAGQIGAKPQSINKKALENGLRIAKILVCKEVLNQDIYFQRKHYFYPDLPSGYQRTSKPIATEGKLGNIGIWEVHLEEDPGRYELRKGIVDYNRSGIPLAEIVTAPDLRSPLEAKEFLERLERYLRYFDLISNEVGNMRVDANISLEGGKRVEIKNINSFSNVEDALNFEIKRQITQIEQGIEIVQETRHFDENSGITIRMRKKETADDYRYVPDPDILPIVIDERLLRESQATIEELPDQRTQRLAEKYGIESSDARVMVIEREFADIFEEISKTKQIQPQKLANWMRGPLRKQLNYRSKKTSESGLRIDEIRELYEMFEKGEISDSAADQILISLLDGESTTQTRKIRQIAEERGLLKNANKEEIRKICEDAIRENEKSVADYKSGKEKALFFIVGKIMQKTKGAADAKEIEALLKSKITEKDNQEKIKK